jgi:hypothetical protein
MTPLLVPFLCHNDSLVPFLCHNGSLVPFLCHNDSLVPFLCHNDSLVPFLCHNDSLVPFLCHNDSLVPFLCHNDSLVPFLCHNDSLHTPLLCFLNISILCMNHPHWCYPQMCYEVFSHTQLRVLRMFIIWQPVSTSSIVHLQAIVQGHKCVYVQAEILLSHGN